MMWISDERIIRLAKEYGTPLYVYDEKTLRRSCRDMHDLLPNKNFRVSYSAKANSNVEIMKIIRDEDIDVDAMSPGEIYLQQLAGFTSEQIFFIPNNVSVDEMRCAIDRDIMVSVDSLSQLGMYGRINPGGSIAVRFNSSNGLGHHDKVVTAGKKTKFGIPITQVGEVKSLLEKYGLKIVGINQHLGSFVLTKEPYLDGAKELLEVSKQFSGLSVIDFGGGFGVPYKENDQRLDLAGLSLGLDEMLTEFLREYDNKSVMFRIEPGRYIPAECGILLGTVHSVKTNHDMEYIGTDIGFNVLMRPVLYDSYHAIHIAQSSNTVGQIKPRTVVGNICESGDIIAKGRELPQVNEGAIVVVQTVGAYGFSMSSNYNCRLRPAEVLISTDGTHRLIRRRETFEDLIGTFL